MRHKKRVTISVMNASFAVLAFLPTPTTWCAVEAKKPFTVADEIRLTTFGHPNAERTPAAQFSPDGKYLLVVAERGRLHLNQIETSLRFYRTADIRKFLADSDNTDQPSPFWVAKILTMNEVESDWRWLADSSRVALLEPAENGNRRLLLVDHRKRRVKPLTPTTQDVVDFDVRDPDHYVYAALSSQSHEINEHTNEVVGTGRSLWELIFASNPRMRKEIDPPPKYLWGVIGGRRVGIKHQGRPFVPDGALAMSPDGNFLVTKTIVPEVPQSWKRRFHVDSNHGAVHEYVLIDLRTGLVRALTNTPISDDARAFVPQGEWAVSPAAPNWSRNGREILLPGAFVEKDDKMLPNPCLVSFDLSSNTGTCVEKLKKQRFGAGNQEDFHYVTDARFADGGEKRVVVTYDKTLYGDTGTIEYRCSSDGTWQVATESKGNRSAVVHGVKVDIRQGLDVPPVLVAANSHSSRVLWDPNPQLKDLDLGQVSVYAWKDKEAREWKAGLFKPSNYKAGVRYPLVIQTHGFVESEFLPSGLYPTAFAARELAAAGIVVVQVAEHSMDSGLSPEDAPTAVRNYETVVRQLISEGLVDPNKIGIIGFSHTCYYVMQALTMSHFHLSAASITEGEMGGYFQYLQHSDEVMRELFDAEIGTAPFGEGLKQWIKSSPGFNLDKVNAPLMVVGNDRLSLLLMWETYAGLRVLHKPVDLIMLRAHEHILTNPGARLASQGGSVDWFRFWLQGHEDPDPRKAEQYARWRCLRSMKSDAQRSNVKCGPF
jgi:dipeptidyl aminopeptidase/acylaminoacyl peptidase